MSEQDPLDVLLVDTREIDRRKLASLLHDRVGVDPENGEILLYPPAQEGRTIGDQVLFTLLGQRVLNLYRSELPDGLTPQELSKQTGIKGGSIRPALARLSSDGLVFKREKRYTVPSHSLNQLEERLGANDE